MAVVEIDVMLRQQKQRGIGANGLLGPPSNDGIRRSDQASHFLTVSSIPQVTASSIGWTMKGMIPSPTAVGVHFLATLLRTRLAGPLFIAVLIALTWNARDTK